MPKIIRGNAIVDDQWVVVDAGSEVELTGEATILPLTSWLKLDEQARYGGNTAPWIESGEEFEECIEQLRGAPLIALNFPNFMDGRGFSSAEILRREGYRGELRAIGNLIQDQLFFLKRCGFDSIQLRDGTDLQAALSSLQDFSVTYQTSCNTDSPLFRRRR